MNNGELLPGGWRDVDTRRDFRERLRWEEFEGQGRDRFPEVGPGCAVPGIDGIEPFEQRALGCGNAHEIETSIGDRPCAIREPN